MLCLVQGEQKEVKYHGFHAVQSCRPHWTRSGGCDVLMLIPFNVYFVQTYVRRDALIFLVQTSVGSDLCKFTLEGVEGNKAMNSMRARTIHCF